MVEAAAVGVEEPESPRVQDHHCGIGVSNRTPALRAACVCVCMCCERKHHPAQTSEYSMIVVRQFPGYACPEGCQRWPRSRACTRPADASLVCEDQPWPSCTPTVTFAALCEGKRLLEQ